MELIYQLYSGSCGDCPFWEQVVRLNQEIFGPESRLQSAPEKDELMLLAAFAGDRLIGYKIGYPVNQLTFYSWMGGVDPEFRGRGIGKELLQRQHQWCQKQGYLEITTKTQNRWRRMLILNLNSGFDITGVSMDRRGELKILMSKKLDPSRAGGE